MPTQDYHLLNDALTKHQYDPDKVKHNLIKLLLVCESATGLSPKIDFPIAKLKDIIISMKDENKQQELLAKEISIASQLGIRHIESL